MKLFNFLSKLLAHKERDLVTLQKKAEKAFKDFAATEGGQDFLEYMHVMYCQYSAIADTPEKTYANLANKELVESLIRNACDITMENKDE